MASGFFGDFIKPAAVTALFALLAAPVTAQTIASVEVVFSQPDKFTDVGPGHGVKDKQRDSLLAQLARHLEQRAAKHVSVGGKLSVTIIDVDMAGAFEPWRGPNAANIRIVKDIYPPRIVLDFRLTGADGRVLGEGRRNLSDLAFMTYIDNRNDSLKYEKKLLDDWLQREFPEAGNS